MRKKILGLTIALAAITSGAIYAQQPDGKTTATQQTEECCQTPQTKKDAIKKGNRQGFNPFDGVQLTPEQQEKIKVLQQGLGPVMLPKDKATGEDKQKLTDEQKKQMKLDLKSKKDEAKKNYLYGVKEILTPEQYVIFLENVYLYGPEQQKGSAYQRGVPVIQGEKGKRQGQRPAKAQKGVKHEK